MKVTQAQFDEMARVGTVGTLEIVDAVPVEADPVVEAPAVAAPLADPEPAV